MSLALHPELPAHDEALVDALRRPIGQGQGWGLVRTLLLSTITFGILPLLAWPLRLRDLFAGEAARLMQISAFAGSRGEVWRYQLGLRLSARRTAPWPVLWIIPILCAIVVIAALMQLVVASLVTNPGDLIQITYRAADSFRFEEPDNRVKTFFLLWATLLSAGYVIHFIHVELHFYNVRQFLIRLNALLAMRGVRTIPLPKRTVMPNLFWLAGGAVLAGCIGAWWAVPMVVAGALQRRDAFAMHRDLRQELADRVKALSIAHSLPEMRCQTPKCQAVLKPGARFCPRCGSAVSPLSGTGGVWA